MSTDTVFSILVFLPLRCVCLVSMRVRITCTTSSRVRPSEAMGCGLIALQREIKIRFADLDDLTCICYGLTACVALILFIENRYKAVSKSPVPHMEFSRET